MLKGIDVWSGNGVIDWAKVKQAGVAFAYVRAAYGDVADHSAAGNLLGARAAGVKAGVYHFLRTSRDYPKQIDLMLQLIDTLKVRKGDLPPAIDVEDNPANDGPWDPANNDKYLTALDRWVEAVRNKTGAWPVIYTRAGFWEQLGNPTVFKDCPLWVASYRPTAPRLPKTWTQYAFWQFSDQGEVSGVPGDVDLSYFSSADSRALERLLLK